MIKVTLKYNHWGRSQGSITEEDLGEPSLTIPYRKITNKRLCFTIVLYDHVLQLDPFKIED